jgi:hypothetical protein
VPRLVLVDDNGREMFSGQVSQANVARTAAFLRRHMKTFQAIAAAKNAMTAVVEGVEQLTGALALAPPAPRGRRSRR